MFGTDISFEHHSACTCSRWMSVSLPTLSQIKIAQTSFKRGNITSKIGKTNHFRWLHHYIPSVFLVGEAEFTPVETKRQPRHPWFRRALFASWSTPYQLSALQLSSVLQPNRVLSPISKKSRGKTVKREKILACERTCKSCCFENSRSVAPKKLRVDHLLNRIRKL